MDYTDNKFLPHRCKLFDVSMTENGLTYEMNLARDLVRTLQGF